MSYLISIIITNFNGENDIPNLISSMKEQTIGFENIELVIADDKSQDRSREILEEYSHKYENVKPVFLEENSKSPGRPRNFGIREASADYIMFCDQDDFYKSDFCEVMYNEISVKDVDFVSSRFTICENGNEYLNNNFLDKFDSNIEIRSISGFCNVNFSDRLSNGYLVGVEVNTYGVNARKQCNSSVSITLDQNKVCYRCKCN